MNIDDFNFELPLELIAQFPLAERSASRLLCLDKKTGETTHHSFTDIKDHLRPGDLLVFNDTKVIPARIYAKKETGGQLEILLERILDELTMLAHVKSSKSPKPGSKIIINDEITLTVVERQDSLFVLRHEGEESILSICQRHGQVPLPRYIERCPDSSDSDRYQTVYAKYDGAVAAPTAGLHFDDVLLNELREQGVGTCFVTLHVGAGTFQPVRVDSITDHKMHAETMTLTEAAAAQINACRGRIVAVGTTSVRCLETATDATGQVRAYTGDTDIFIYPGYTFKCVDAMITNFHLPKSTLLMLLSAFAGREAVFRAYAAAIEAGYRFYSYGDAMFISDGQ